MLLTAWNAAPPERGRCHIALIFGVGLVGEAVFSSLKRLVSPAVARLPFSWHSRELRAGQAAAILNETATLADAGRRPITIDVVWSAGRAGFGAGETELKAEEAAFLDVLQILRKLHDVQREAATLRFHLVSSAGGLFEGERYVDAKSRPHPRRPYGAAKLRQESLADALPATVGVAIYRPSTVYGFAGATSRTGLIAALIQGGLRNRTTRIYARPDTLRDFVYADDIGAFIARRITGTSAGNSCHLLASGKPTSAQEAVMIVESVLNRRLFLQYEPGTENTASNTFRPSSLAADWNPTALGVGITRTELKMARFHREAAS